MKETLADAIFALCQSNDSTPETANHADLMLYRHCREGRTSSNALYFDGRTYTYGQVAEMSARCAAWLRLRGIEPGDCVIVSMPDCASLAAIYFGIVATGAIAIVIDPALQAEKIFYITQLCGARLVIAHEKSVVRLQELGSIPSVTEVIGAGLTWTSESELGAALSLTQPDFVVHRNPAGYAYGLLSSGSTGPPKLIVHRHQDILHGYFAFARPVLRISVSDRVISVAKMSTGYGLGCSLLMPFLQGASAALVAESPGSGAMTDAIEAYRCTLLFAQPRFLADVVSRPELAANLRSLRLVITGGEPLAGKLSERWVRFSQAELLDSYGSTEVGFLYISNRSGEARPNSVGRPLEGLQVEVLDAEGNAVRPGQTGKLRVRGPMIIDSYWNDPLRSENSFLDGWFVSSDIFSFDPDGYYYIHGRSDHLIKLGCGDWVNPAELEMVLQEHPSVRECVIGGVPDSRGLTVLKAWIVTDASIEGDHTLAVELGEKIQSRWAMQDYMRIATIEFTSTLPKTIAGKVDRASLGTRSMTEFSYKC